MTVTDLKSGSDYAPVATSDEKPKLEKMELEGSQTKVTHKSVFASMKSNGFFFENLKEIIQFF